MPQGRDGQALRARFLNYLKSTTDTIDGMPPDSWLEQPLEEYCREMERGNVRDDRTWGGFAEACIIANALDGEASVLMLDVRDDGAHAIAWSNPTVRDPTRVVCLAWWGRHWQRARLSETAWNAFFDLWARERQKKARH